MNEQHNSKAEYKVTLVAPATSVSSTWKTEMKSLSDKLNSWEKMNKTHRILHFRITFTLESSWKSGERWFMSRLIPRSNRPNAGGDSISRQSTSEAWVGDFIELFFIRRSGKLEISCSTPLLAKWTKTKEEIRNPDRHLEIYSMKYTSTKWWNTQVQNDEIPQWGRRYCIQICLIFLLPLSLCRRGFSALHVPEISCVVHEKKETRNQNKYPTKKKNTWYHPRRISYLQYPNHKELVALPIFLQI
jgi:hypothetical protein